MKTTKGWLSIQNGRIIIIASLSDENIWKYGMTLPSLKAEIMFYDGRRDIVKETARVGVSVQADSASDDLWGPVTYTPRVSKSR